MENPESERPEAEAVVDKIKGALKDWVGLPPGRGAPQAEDGSAAADVPSGTLTSADAVGLPPHAGTGIAVDE